MNFSEKLQQTLGKAIKDASNEEIYAAPVSYTHLTLPTT